MCCGRGTMAAAPAMSGLWPAYECSSCRRSGARRARGGPPCRSAAGNSGTPGAGAWVCSRRSPNRWPRPRRQTVWCAVADGVVGDTLDVAQTHRQQRLGAIAGLVLRFLFNAEQNCLIGRVEVEPYDVSQRLDKEGIVAELVAFRLARSGTFSGDGAAERRSAASGAPYFWRCL